MPPIVFFALRALHLLSMAVWFGGGLTVAGDVRRTISRGKPHTDILAARIERSLGIGAVAATFTLLSGLGMVFAQGGFGAISPRIHAGFALSLIVFAVELLGLRPTVAKLGQTLANGEAKDLKPIQARIAMFTGIGHLLKLVILCLMVFKL
ncbi:MAG: hypothetical protein JNK04_14525 [Myxococcales bacterium]|nr:hypothetical protein [Myxococcales bacterium]